ncbi:3-demethylubiquinone-9 3-methyltransferase [Nannizzia gypsea CBS 118893]|uniref:3-demethylubiquinone-9 3-methyltransferase n=1 Tax=Arthroderma gypseum (strain ATCC MYA-4604 / CBS 118893) TaxID=535722 RepID=E4UVC7_ARTGP|nr:3-demethylubiquinone-9 3-methyltransferase [Nannizzia gypsea CBS 118893]EFR02254.1 3-demethylubiquinone-9 3-methyltransferase [Nannizzia gypsea CBS 118893]
MTSFPTQKIHPCLWFDKEGVEAARLYTSIFANNPHSKTKGDSYIVNEAAITNDSAVLVSFKLGGQEYSALNGGPHYQHTPAISMFVTCEDQAEVDYFWDALLKDGGKPVQCGWLTDKFGVSWQIVPRALMVLSADEDREKANRVQQAMMQCVKMDVKKLEDAYNGVQ